MRRTRNPAREAAFAEDMANADWESAFRGLGVDGMAAALEASIRELTKKHFPLARVRKRSNESPWITRAIRRLWKRKIRLYKKAGKCQAWWDTDRLLQAKIAESRNNFVDRMIEEGCTGKSFYAATRKLAAANTTSDWSVRDLFSGCGPEEICNEVLSYYGAISGGCLHPVPDLLRTAGGLGHFSSQRTSELLQQSKKTELRVDGDPLAHLIRRFPTAFADPVFLILS